jgi:hypothetical protein
MNRDETVALFLQGKEAWNAWAEKMLAERKAMEADGRWNAEEDEWSEKAEADFSHCLFAVRGVEGNKEAAGKSNKENSSADLPVKSISLGAESINFEGFVFPGEALFQSATFTGPADFLRVTFTGNAVFQDATFTGPADFLSTTFADAADFTSVAFTGVADFWRVTFTSPAKFQNVTFTGPANFLNATFTGDAVFRDATFTGSADFQNVIITGPAFFGSATFAGDAKFRSAAFQNAAFFVLAIFHREAHFTGLKVDRAVDMTRADFARVPAFNQADFKQAPDLDDVMFPLPGFWRGHNANLISRYRAIRRIAIQGADYEREQMAFKGEIRSKRGTEHKWHDAALWFGVVYDGLSDFGRSMMRPLYVWAFSVAAFGAVYFLNAGATEWLGRCAGNDASRALKALALSAANGLPLIGSSRWKEADAFYACVSQGHVPDWSPFIQIGQTVWSTLLIFLFLLAVRNQFKIK